MRNQQLDILIRELKLPEEREILISWLTSEAWPFHVNSHLSVAQVADSIDSGTFSAPNAQTFWIHAVNGNQTQEGERVGLIRIFDLEDIEDGSPLFDLRISSAFREKGIGKAALNWLTKYLFEQYPSLNRIEANTRVDNVAMRQVLRSCGYVKEGHFRQSWPAPDGHRFDSVHYGILRHDWETGTTTKVPRDDE